MKRNSRKKSRVRKDLVKTAALIPRADTTPAISAGRIVQVFQNVDLRNGVDGLLRIAAEGGLDLDKLPVGHYPVFINSQKDRFMILSRSKSGRGWIISYYKSYDGRVTRDEIEQVPQSFGIKRPLATSERLANKIDETLKYQRVRDVN